MGDRSPTSPRHLPRGSPPVTPGRESAFSVDAEGSPITPRRAPPRASGPLSKVTPVPSADMPTINKVRALATVGPTLRPLSLNSLASRLFPTFSVYLY